VTSRLVAASQGRAEPVPWPQGAGGGLWRWWGPPEPGWGAWGRHPRAGVREQALGYGFSWSPRHLIRSRRADSSPEPACGRRCGNPRAAAVAELCKVHIARRLPRRSSCRGFQFQGSWKSLPFTPADVSSRQVRCSGGARGSRSSHPDRCTREHQTVFEKAEFGVVFVAAALGMSCLRGFSIAASWQEFSRPHGEPRTAAKAGENTNPSPRRRIYRGESVPEVKATGTLLMPNTTGTRVVLRLGGCAGPRCSAR